MEHAGGHDREGPGRPTRRRLPGLALALLSFPIGFAAARAGTEPLRLETVDAIEPLPGGAHERFGEPLIQRSGQVVYSRIAAFGTTGGGIWTGERTAAPLVRPGDEAPGVPGARFRGIGELVTDGAGGVAFLAALELGPGGVTSENAVGLWATDAAGAIELVARVGEQAPGLPPGARFDSIRSPMRSEAGALAFLAGLARFSGGVNLDNFQTLWLWDASGVRIVARSDSQAPGLAPGTRFTGFGRPVMNPLGELAFRANLRHPSPAPSSSVWSVGPGGEPALALSGGTPAPAAGAFLQALGTPDATDSGELLLLAWLEPGRGGVTTSNDAVLLRVSRDREVALVAREGTQAPGAPPGAVYDNLLGRVTSRAGAVAWWANLRLGAGGVGLGDNIGFWLAEPAASPMLLFRRGEELPGLGLRFEGPVTFALNSAGDLVCLCSLADASGTLAHTLLRRTRDGALDVIARTGESLALAPGDVRRVSSLGFAGSWNAENGDGNAGTGLSELGEIAFRASFFPDGHARILRATTRAPEPPVADAGGDRTLECTSPGGARARLDGSASSDPDSTELAFTWSNDFGVLSGPSVEVPLALGVHAVTLTVEDPTGLSDSDEIEISVVDTTPPVIGAARARPDALWPPNGKLVPVQVEVAAADTCDPAPRCRIVEIASSERPRHRSRPAARITGELSAELRAERSGGSPGRTYTLGLECSDASQNAARSEVEVRVPHRAPTGGGG